MNAKTNSLKLGVILGFLLPIVAFGVIYLFNMETYERFMGNKDSYNIIHRVILKLGSLSVIPNLLLFFLFIRNDALYSARGVLLSTFVFGILIFIAYYAI